MTELTPEEAAIVERFERAPDALAEDLRDEVAEVLLRKFQTPETEWAKRDLWSDALADADALLPLIAQREEAARAEALREAADELVWVRPKVSPCSFPEGCCGSEQSCDAMKPSVKVVGEDWLRDRAARIARGDA